MAACAHDHGLSGKDRDRLDALLGSLPGAVVYRLVTTEEGGRDLVYVSPAIEPIFGLAVEDVRMDPKRWYDLLHPDDAARVADEEEVAVHRRTEFRTEARYVLPDGRQRIFDIHSSPSVQDDGCVLWNGVATDVTQSVLLREERQRLLDLIGATPDIIAIVTVEGEIEYLNPGGRRLLGLASEGSIDQTAGAFHGALEREIHAREALPEVARSGVWVGETKVTTAAGDEIPVTQIITATPREDGTITHYATIMRDLRQQKAAETALLEANESVQVALREVNHRIKNFFALVPALVKLSARTAADAPSLAEGIEHRIAALSRSHALTLNAFSPDHGVALDALIRAVLEPYEDAADAFSFSGPSMRLSGRIGNAVALALHELATNAAKHGVFSTPGGRVTISWAAPENENGRSLHMTWQEDGGPPVAGPPKRSGFGTSLLDRLIAAQGGTVDRSWRRQGLRVSIHLPRT